MPPKRTGDEGAPSSSKKTKAAPPSDEEPISIVDAKDAAREEQEKRAAARIQSFSPVALSEATLATARASTPAAKKLAAAEEEHTDAVNVPLNQTVVSAVRPPIIPDADETIQEPQKDEQKKSRNVFSYVAGLVLVVAIALSIPISVSPTPSNVLEGPVGTFLFTNGFNQAIEDFTKTAVERGGLAQSQIVGQDGISEDPFSFSK